MLDRIALEILFAASVLQRTLASTRAKDCFRIRSGKCVPGDCFSPRYAFEQERIFCVALKPKVSGNGREQVCRESLIDRHKISLLGQSRKRREVRLNHGVARKVSLREVRRASRTALRMAAAGARWPVHVSHCAIPCARNISSPDTVSIPRRAASCKSFVLTGRYIRSNTSRQFNSCAAKGERAVCGYIPTGVALTMASKNSVFSRARDNACPPIARASFFASSGRRAQMETAAPDCASANATARAEPPAPRISTRLLARITRS